MLPVCGFKYTDCDRKQPAGKVEAEVGTEKGEAPQAGGRSASPSGPQIVRP